MPLDYLKKTVLLAEPHYQSEDPELTTKGEKGHLRVSTVRKNILDIILVFF